MKLRFVVYCMLAVSPVTAQFKTDSTRIAADIERNFVTYANIAALSNGFRDKITPVEGNQYSKLKGPWKDCWLDLVIRKANIAFPDTSYQMLEFYNSNGAMRCLDADGRRTFLVDQYRIYSTRLVDKGLVAYRPSFHDFLFVSGYVFLDDIYSICFPKSLFRLKYAKAFVSLKYFNYDPEILSASEKEGKVLFYSKLLDKNYEVRFTINRSNEVYGDELKEIPKKTGGNKPAKRR